MSRRTLAVLAIPFVVFGVLGGAFALWKPGIIVSTLGSLQALAISAGVFVLTAAVVLGSWRLSGRPWIGAAAGLLPALGFLAVTAGPAFRETRVVEQLPAAAATAATPASSVPPTAVAGPTVLRSGTLSGVDHRASGRALLVRLPDGQLVVRLEDLDVEPGPDYQLHLVPGTGTTRTDGGAWLGGLRANKGSQNYPVPAGVDVGGPRSVLVWCRAFAVPIAVATLT